MQRSDESKTQFFMRKWAHKTTEELEHYVKVEDRRTARVKAAAMLFMDRPDADLRMMSDWERTPPRRRGRQRWESRRRADFQFFTKAGFKRTVRDDSEISKALSVKDGVDDPGPTGGVRPALRGGGSEAFMQMETYRIEARWIR